MHSIIFDLIIFYISIFIFGTVIEKVKIPKIYAALFLGVLLSNNQYVLSLLKEPSLQTLTQIGMFCLLFLLGFNLDINQIKKQRSLITRVTISMISAELVVGTLMLHFIFNVSWGLAAFISLSFATVGEVAILPILEEFKMVKTKLGQSILGISILDDTVEIASFIILIFYISKLGSSEIINELIPLFAIISGIILKKFTSKIFIPKVESLLKVFSYMIFGPLFFFYAGTEANLNILISKWWIIIFMSLVIKLTKLVSVYLSSHAQLGFKKSIVMAVSLSIKFSTSIVILIILLQKGLISEELFSVLIGMKVVFKFVVPILLSYLLKSWHIELKKT